jgi:hypothetical protein
MEIIQTQLLEFLEQQPALTQRKWVAVRLCPFHHRWAKPNVLGTISAIMNKEKFKYRFQDQIDSQGELRHSAEKAHAVAPTLSQSKGLSAPVASNTYRLHRLHSPFNYLPRTSTLERTYVREEERGTSHHKLVHSSKTYLIRQSQYTFFRQNSVRPARWKKNDNPE